MQEAREGDEKRYYGPTSHKAVGPKESGAKEKDQENVKTEEKLTQELLLTAHQQYNEAVGATYELL